MSVWLRFGLRCRDSIKRLLKHKVSHLLPLLLEPLLIWALELPWLVSELLVSIQQLLEVLLSN